MPDHETQSSELHTFQVKILLELAELRATLGSQAAQSMQHRADSSSYQNTVKSKLDNLDRSLGELMLAYERDGKTRKDSEERLFGLLGEERGDRRRAVDLHVESSQDEDLRSVILAILQEERGDRRDGVAGKRAQAAARESVSMQIWLQLWEKGGLPIVSGAVVLILYLLSRAFGIVLPGVGG